MLHCVQQLVANFVRLNAAKYCKRKQDQWELWVNQNSTFFGLDKHNIFLIYILHIFFFFPSAIFTAFDMDVCVMSPF